MKLIKCFIRLFILAILLLCGSCKSTSKTAFAKAETTKINSPWAQQQPYVVLISLDGFRYDYLERFKPANLLSFVNQGIQAESLIPVYPSKTFPNHYSIATGMYPDKHGLLGNLYYNTELATLYNTRNRATVEDGRFYGGTPIWVQASRAGMVTASYFFVGTEAPVQGVQPTYWYTYDGRVTKDDRVEQALNWLALPPETRPHLITLYFSDMDNTGHRYGPNNDLQLNTNLNSLDAALGKLFKGVDQTELPVNIVIVSDHGMAAIKVDQTIPLDPLLDEDLYITVDNGSLLNIHPKDSGDTDMIMESLQSKADHFKVYKTSEVPYFEVPPSNPDWGPIQLIPDDGYYFVREAVIALRASAKQKEFGVHGFPTEQKDMHGIFYAKGPQLQSNMVLPAFKNIHIYPLLCKLLGLEIPTTIDGSIAPVKKGLKPPN